MCSCLPCQYTLYEVVSLYITLYAVVSLYITIYAVVPLYITLYAPVTGVVIIDEMTGNKEDSDGWQDEDGFQEVVSRKTRKVKQRQEQEAAVNAAKAAASELAKKERALAFVSHFCCYVLFFSCGTKQALIVGQYC